MQKKKEKFSERIGKKDYNNLLETVLERKQFDKQAKNLLLNILYKVEISYKDYSEVKRKVKTKEEYIESFIDMVEKNCDIINVPKMNSEEAEKLLKKKEYIIDKDKKQIVCYPIERKLLYCVSKISKKDSIVKDDYPIISKTMSNMINIGNCIDTVEPLRDFNGYSWATIDEEIESIEYNLIYQNLRMLLGYEFLENWIKNNEYIMDYMEILENRLEEKYGENNKKEIMELLKKLSVLLEMKYNSASKRTMKRQKNEVEQELSQIENREEYIKKITEEKKDLKNQIKEIDSAITDKKRLQREYEKANKKMASSEKIFSARLLSKKLLADRKKILKKIDKLNDLMNPKKFVENKNQLEEKYKYLKLVDIKNMKKEIKTTMVKFQKVFLKCYKLNIEKAESKTEMIDYIYEFRYYNLLPISEENKIADTSELEKEKKEVRKTIYEKGENLKVMTMVSKDENVNDDILCNIFNIRQVSLKKIGIKLIKENDKIYLHFFDDDVFEEKIEIPELENADSKELGIKINKKIKIFN